MPVKYNPGDTADIFESGLFVREVEVVKAAGGFVTLHFADADGGVRLRESRLYPTKEDAEAYMRKSPHPRSD